MRLTASANAPILGILGGMGPASGIYFCELLTKHTKVEKDSDHIDFVLSSKATIPQHTAFMAKKGPSPLPDLLAQTQRLVAFGAGVIAIPCNAAHMFYNEIQQSCPVPVLHMVDRVVEQAVAERCQKLGILATDGTLQAGVYQTACQKYGVPYALPQSKGQQQLMKVIFEDIKAGKQPNIQAFFGVAYELFAAGCDKIVLGCSELSLVGKMGLLDGRYIDSMQVLAKEAVRACKKELRF